jgi:hypothetical protein
MMAGIRFPAGVTKDGTHVPEKVVGATRDVEGRVGNLTFRLSDANLEALRVLDESFAGKKED